VKGSRAAIDHRTRVGQERSARTETRILTAALKVFAERGPDAPVIDEFVQAAGIARGTFYNYFKSVEELLLATSEWTTREVVESVEHAMEAIEGPTLRVGVGLRLFFARAMRDPVWCRFVARVWNLGGLELPLRDIDEGIRLGHFRVPSRDAVKALMLGLVREALGQIGEREVPPSFVDQLVEILLYALRADPRRIAGALAHELPVFPERGLTRADSTGVEAVGKRARGRTASGVASSRRQARRR
jgi:AcrR family transcriptional regulator